MLYYLQVLWIPFKIRQYSWAHTVQVISLAVIGDNLCTAVADPEGVLLVLEPPPPPPPPPNHIICIICVRSVYIDLCDRVMV